MSPVVHSSIVPCFFANSVFQSGMRSEDDEPFHGFVENSDINSDRPVNDRHAALRRGRRVSTSRSRERLLRRRSRSASVDSMSNVSLEWDNLARDTPMHMSLRDARAAAREAARDSRRMIDTDVRISPRRSPPLSDRQPAAGQERQEQPDGEDDAHDPHGAPAAASGNGGAVPRRGQVIQNPNNAWPPPPSNNPTLSQDAVSPQPPAQPPPQRGAEATATADNQQGGSTNSPPSADIAADLGNLHIQSTPVTAEDHHILLITAELNFEDEIENCSARELPTDIIREKIDISNSIKEMINEAEVFLMRERNIEFMRDRRKWKRIKVATLAFRNQCYSVLHTRE